MGDDTAGDNSYISEGPRAWLAGDKIDDTQDRSEHQVGSLLTHT